MHYKNLILIACGLLMIGCQDTKDMPKPKHLIPEKKMVKVLVDLSKINATMSLSMRKYKERKVNAKTLVFKKYNIDSLQLVQSNAYYAQHFKINKRIYEQVINELQKENDSLYTLNSKENEQREKERKEEGQKALKELQKKPLQLK